MIDLLFIVAVAVVAWFLGYSRGVKNTTELMIDHPDRFQKIMKMIEQQRLDQPTEGQDSARELVIERHDNIYLAYDREGVFLAQGSEFRQLLAQIRVRFPGESFRVMKYNAQLTDEETQRLIDSVHREFGDEAAGDSTKKP